jgi:hypothetical protein
MFDVFSNNVKEADFLAFKSDVIDRIAKLGEEIKLKATDSDELAKQAAASAAESWGRIKQTESDINNALATLNGINLEAKKVVGEIENDKSVVNDNNSQLLVKIKEVDELYVEIMSLKKQVDSAIVQVDENIEKFNAALAKSEKLPDDVDAASKLLESSKGVSDSIQDLLTHSMTKKAGIDDLYNKILGYELKDSEGKSERIDGLKDKLEQSYTEVASRTSVLAEEVQGKVDLITQSHNAQLDEQKNSFEELISNSSRRIDAINGQLTGLLPGAMAEGLSAAYEKKKDDEVVSLKDFEKQFKIAIGLMVSVSLIPFFVDVYLLTAKDIGIIKVIQDTPKMIMAILPLYFPVLWLAYSLNKKVNLSKRLIEEYTHKAVLGKTFSGLSNQIDTLPGDGEMKNDLRTRLLFNLLQVSSENPGKLISDYNKSDHPLMDVIEKSAKLSDAMDTLAKIPGLSAITKTVVDRAEKKLENETKRVMDGVVLNETMEEKKENAPAQV